MPFNLSRPWYQRRSPAHIAIFMGAAGIILTVGAAAWIGWTEYSRRLQETRQTVETETYFLSDHASRLFEGAHVGLQMTTALIGVQSWDEIEQSQPLYRQLRSFSAPLPYIQNVWLHDEAGTLRATSFDFPPPRGNGPDSENFLAIKAGYRDLYVGPRVIGRLSHRPTFLVSERLDTNDRSFRGMVSVTVDLSYFADYWQAVKLSPGSRIALYRVAPSGEAELLVQFPASDDDVTLLPVPVPVLVAHPTTVQMLDGTVDFVGARPVGGFPVILSVAIPRASAIAGWWSWLAIYGPLTGIAVVGLGLLTALAIRQARVDDATRSALLETNRELTAEMHGREQAEQQVLQMQKIQAIGQLTGGIAHDFNNLLTVIIGNADMLISEASEKPRLRQAAKMVLAAAERGAELTNRLLAFARRQPLDPYPIDVNALLRNFEKLLRQTLGADVDLQFVSGAGLWAANVDPGQLETAIINLAVNARDAMPQGGKLTIETANASVDDAYAAAHEEVAPGQYVLIAVSDTGTGMTDDVMMRAFEPFYTTKAIGKGSGLGLSMVYGFVKQSGGHVKIYSEPGSGTTVKMYLPRSMEAASQRRRPRRENDPLTGDERVLVVEDDADVLAFATEALKEFGYEVVSEIRAAEALERIEAGEVFDLLITDVILPDGIDGPTLAARATQRLPHLKVLFISGYTENAIIHQGRLDQGVQLLSKPFRRTDLAAKVRKVIEG